jgi:hypothetical protein
MIVTIPFKLVKNMLFFCLSTGVAIGCALAGVIAIVMVVLSILIVFLKRLELLLLKM